MVEIVSDISLRPGFPSSFCFCVSGHGRMYWRVGLFDCKTSHEAEICATTIALEQLPPQTEPIICFTDYNGFAEVFPQFLAGETINPVFVPVMQRLQNVWPKHASITIKYWTPEERDDRYHACHSLAKLTRRDRTRVRFEHYRKAMMDQINLGWLDPDESYRVAHMSCSRLDEKVNV